MRRRPEASGGCAPGRAVDSKPVAAARLMPGVLWPCQLSYRIVRKMRESKRETETKARNEAVARVPSGARCCLHEPFRPTVDDAVRHGQLAGEGVAGGAGWMREEGLRRCQRDPSDGAISVRTAAAQVHAKSQTCGAERWQRGSFPAASSTRGIGHVHATHGGIAGRDTLRQGDMGRRAARRARDRGAWGGGRRRTR